MQHRNTHRIAFPRFYSQNRICLTLSISLTQATFLKNCDLNDCLSNKDDNATFTGTKIIGTIGPGCRDTAVLADMLKAGMVGARVDLTAGNLPFHRASLENLQVASRQTQKLCCVIVDTKGRTIMVKREGKLDELGWPWYPKKLEVGCEHSHFELSSLLPASYPPSSC